MSRAAGCTFSKYLPSCKFANFERPTTMARREPSLAPPASSSPHIEETAPVLAGESSVGGGLGGGEGDEGGGSSASSQLKATGSGVFLVLDGGDSAAKWDAKLQTVRPHSAPALPGQHRPNHRFFVAGLGRSAVQQGTCPEPCPVSRALLAPTYVAGLAPTYEPYTPCTVCAAGGRHSHVMGSDGRPATCYPAST